MTAQTPSPTTSPGGVRGWWSQRTLRTRLIAGVLLLLLVACAGIGAATTLTLRGFLLHRLDQQLADAGRRLAFRLEHPKESSDSRDLSAADLRGQAIGTFGARLVAGTVTSAAVIEESNEESNDLVTLSAVRLSTADQRALSGLPATSQPRSIDLSGLGAYRMVAVQGEDGDVFATGLPLSSLNAIVHRLEVVDVVVFAAVLLATAVVGTAWVRVSLRPLDRVAATAREVTRLPLGSGEVVLPAGVADTEPTTEVGQVGTAFNHMLTHVSAALSQRQASEQRLRQFIADASHELRTPLAAIRSHTELARRDSDCLPDEVGHALTRVDAELARMGALVDDLLLLARLDAGRPLAREPVDLTRTAIDAASDARVAGPQHRWVLDLPDQPVTVTGDQHRLHQVLANLLTNARTHTPPRTTVTVRVKTAPPDRPDAVELTVTDDGPGIAAGLQPRVFERFVRADSSRSRTAGSTGLGLAIVAAVVTAHQGSVTADSRPGHTQFRVLLPADQTPAVLSRPEPSCTLSG